MADWQPIATAPHSIPVLVHYKNSHDKSRVIKARFVARFTEEAGFDYEEGCAEYDEENDRYTTTEGWWEQIDNWPDYGEVAVHEGVPDHWMPLPEPPR